MKEFYNSLKEYRFFTFLLIITFMTTILMMVTFDYCDTDSLTAWSVNVWDLLFQGRLSEFYSYAELNLRGAFHDNCMGNYIWILPWSLWNLPLWIIHSISGELLVTDFWSLCWSKLFLVFLSIITAWMSSKICSLFTEDKRRHLMVYVLVLASPELLMSIGYAGQDEILYIAFFIIALYYFLCEKYGKFYFWSVCSVACCTIMLIPFLALLLIREKNILKIAVAAIGTQVPVLVFEFCYRNNAAYHLAKTDFLSMMGSMFKASTIQVIFGEASVFGVIIVLIYFCCFNMKPDSMDWKRKVIYLLALIFVFMSLFMGNEYYRLFLYVPFMSILITALDENIEMNLFLLNVLTYGRTFMACGVNNPQNMNTRFIMNNSWLSKLCHIVGEKRELEDIELYNKLLWRFPKLQNIVIIIVSCIAASSILLLIINAPPNCRKKYDINLSTDLLLAGYVMCMPALLAVFFFMFLH